MATATDGRGLAGPAGFAAVLAAHQAGQLLGRPELSTWPLFTAYLLLVPLFVVRRPAALWALVALSLVQCAVTFPRTSNHGWLAVLAAALLALREDPRDDAKLAALAVISFFWAGVEKLVHGHWFDGQVLGWLMVNRVDVGAQLRPLLDDATAARLAEGTLDLPLPWRVASNAVWVTELLAPVVLLARGHAWWLLLAGGWAAQAIAHEWEFALLLSLLALAIAQPRARARGHVAVLAGVALLALARLGVLPLPPAFLTTVNL